VKWRVRIAFLCFFVFLIVLSVGAYFIADLGKPEIVAAPERQDLGATATRSTNETNAAIEKLSNELEPPGLSRHVDLGTASRGDLEALRNDLKTAETNATTFMPRYSALLKAGRDRVDNYALSIRADKDAVSKVLDGIDKRHAQTTAFTSGMLTARADYYRAYQNYVDVLIRNFGAYKVVNGEFIFQIQSPVDRYNSAAHAMRIAAKRVNELEEERKTLNQSQQDTEQFGKVK
jgi:hypothetical protein